VCTFRLRRHLSPSVDPPHPHRWCHLFDREVPGQIPLCAPLRTLPAISYSDFIGPSRLSFSIHNLGGCIEQTQRWNHPGCSTFNHEVPGTRGASPPRTLRNRHLRSLDFWHHRPRFLFSPTPAPALRTRLRCCQCRLQPLPTSSPTVANLTINLRKPYHQPSPTSPSTVTNLTIDHQPHHQPLPTSPLTIANFVVDLLIDHPQPCFQPLPTSPQPHHRPLPTSTLTVVNVIVDLIVDLTIDHRQPRFQPPTSP
jgi:hypothetical protein